MRNQLRASYAAHDAFDLRTLICVTPDNPALGARFHQTRMATGHAKLYHPGRLGEAHLRRILRSYAGYYNEVRTHRSQDKDAPVSRAVQRTGIIDSRPIPGGLQHHYVRG
jgi:hypothetical protein